MDTQPPTRPTTTRTGPSREMFGGPWLGVLVFVVIAIGLGWGLISLLQSGLDLSSQTLNAGELDHGFDPDTVYIVKKDLLLGYTADGRKTLLPGKADLPRGVPGRRSAATVAGLRDRPGDFPDLIGVVEHTTRVKFIDVIDDHDNPQTRILVMVKLLDGPYASVTPVVGMHLESADTVEGSEAKRYLPRPDLFEPVNPEPGPVQSPAENR